MNAPAALPADILRRKTDRLVAALLFEGITAAEGARQLAGILNAASGKNGRQRVAGYFRAFMFERHAPCDMVETVAEFVNRFANPFFIKADPWVSTKEQRKLFLFALIAGTCGRTFGMAKNRVAKALSIYPRAVEEFKRKAIRNGIMTERGRDDAPVPGRYRRMTVYALTTLGIAESFEHDAVVDATKEIPWLLREQPTRKDRERILHEIMSHVCV